MDDIQCPHCDEDIELEEGEYGNKFAKKSFTKAYSIPQ